MNNVKDMMSSDLLTKMRTQSHYRKITLAKTLLKHESGPVLVGDRKGDNAGSKILVIAYFDEIVLYTVNTEKLPVLFTTESSFLKSTKKPAPADAHTAYTSGKQFL